MRPWRSLGDRFQRLKQVVSQTSLPGGEMGSEGSFALLVSGLNQVDQGRD